MKRRNIAALLIVFGVFVALSGVAAAGTSGNPSVQVPPTPEEVLPPEVTPPEVKPPTTEVVEPPTGGVEGTIEEEEPTLIESVTDELPFTGFQALIVLGAGAGLAGAGVALRRIGRNKND